MGSQKIMLSIIAVASLGLFSFTSIDTKQPEYILTTIPTNTVCKLGGFTRYEYKEFLPDDCKVWCTRYEIATGMGRSSVDLKTFENIINNN